jgi:putative glycosyltransferase (TIGR04372 family)
VQSYDWISRYYDSDKISLIHIPHPRNNNYLQYCFEDRFDAFAFTSKFFLMSHKVGEISHKIAKFFLYMIKIIKKEIIFMYDHNLVYQSFSSKKNKKFKIYDVETKSMSETSNYIDYYNILQNTKSLNPHLSKNIKNQIEKEIIKIYPNFLKKKFAFILLRKNRTNEYYDKNRCHGPVENYIKSINWLGKNDYNVVLSIDEKYLDIINLGHTFDFSKIKINSNLLNLYLITQCNLFISQHSGAYLLANSFDIPVVLCESYPFFIGTYNPNDVILFKNVIHDKRKLNISEIINEHTDLIYGAKLDTDKYILTNNTEDEILNAISRRNIKKFRFPSDTIIHYTSNFIAEI